MNKSTREVGKLLGVSIKTLQFWVREGFVDAVEVTGTGRQRRIIWTDDGIEQARKMKDRSENGSAIADVYGTDLLDTMRRAKEAKDQLGDSDVVVASPKTVRILQRDRTIRDAIRTVPGTFLIILQ